MMLFSHPEIRPNLSQDGLPIVSFAPFSQLTHDQLNNQWEFSTVVDHLRSCRPSYKLVESGNVLNMITRVMRLTRGKLLKQPDWAEWQTSEHLQLDQYDAQGMFGKPVPVNDDMLVFHSVWTYAIKALDQGRRRNGLVMAPLVQVKQKYSMKPMQIVWIRQACIYSTLLLQRKTS
jgi:hypothetical protein